MNTRALGSLMLMTTLLGPAGAYAGDTPTDTPGQYLDDAAITLKVRTALAEDQLVKTRAISVRTDHGVVDLTGNVNSSDESDRATQLATDVRSVTAVHNNIVVAGL